MPRPLSAALLLLLVLPAARGDAFDRYTNAVLARAPGAAGVREIKQLTADLVADHDRVLPDATAALVVVKTNDGRNALLLAQLARQKVAGKAYPILLVERFVTYKEGQERAVQAAGRNVQLFAGFHLSLDLGQVVPPALGGDLRLVADGRQAYAEPVGKARLFLVTQPLPGAAAPKEGAPAVGATFDPRYFNGTYKLHDDGRRSGELTLRVADSGTVSGAYYSDKDGRKYDVYGKVGAPNYSVTFTIKFPRTEQTFQGWLFTGDARAMAGTSRLLDRETGFYATRVEAK